MRESLLHPSFTLKHAAGTLCKFGNMCETEFLLEEYLMIKDCVKHEPTPARESHDIQKERGTEREKFDSCQSLQKCASMFCFAFFFTIFQELYIRKKQVKLFK